MVLNQEFESWARNAAPAWEKAGADPAAALQFARLYVYAWGKGLGPRITSIFRDPEKQKKMIADWDRGDRQGLRARPADPSQSKHCKTGWFDSPKSLAMDMPCSSAANDTECARLASSLGLTAGEYFRVQDTGHYST